MQSTFSFSLLPEEFVWSRDDLYCMVLRKSFCDKRTLRTRTLLAFHFVEVAIHIYVLIPTLTCSSCTCNGNWRYWRSSRSVVLAILPLRLKMTPALPALLFYQVNNQDEARHRYPPRRLRRRLRPRPERPYRHRPRHL